MMAPTLTIASSGEHQTRGGSGKDLTDLPVGDVPSGTESGDELPTRDNHRNDQRDPGISRRRLSTHAWRMS